LKRPPGASMIERPITFTVRFENLDRTRAGRSRLHRASVCREARLLSAGKAVIAKPASVRGITHRAIAIPNSSHLSPLRVQFAIREVDVLYAHFGRHDRLELGMVGMEIMMVAILMKQILRECFEIEPVFMREMNRGGV